MTELTLREILVRDSEEDGCDWEMDDDALEERLRECYPVVWEGDEDIHRWRIEYCCVADVDGRYFKYSSYKGAGDNDAEGCGYEFEGIDNVQEVQRIVVEAFDYVSI